jgi:hypothetical protein
MYHMFDKVSSYLYAYILNKDQRQMRDEYNKLDNVFITYWEIQNLRISQYIKKWL